MRLRRKYLLSFYVLMFLACAALAAETHPKLAFVRDNNIFVMQATGAVKRLTSDGVFKIMLAWSPDGTKLAFLEHVDQRIALDNLVVIAEDGAPVNQILIQPIEPNSPGTVRWVDTLQWIGNEKIALGGSVNPSTSEVVIFDVRSGKEVDETDADDGEPVFSLDGSHFAGYSGSPHFTPEEMREPEFDVDNKRIYPAPGVRVDFLADPEWSDDGSRVATVAQSEKRGEVTIVLWRADHGVSTILLPLSASYPQVEIFWNSDTLFVKTADQAWKIGDSKRLVSVPIAEAVKPAPPTCSEQKVLEGQARLQGADEVDFWCGDCQPPIRTEKVSTN
jgi:hypothetical protein